MNSAASLEALTVKSSRDGSSVEYFAGMSETRRSVAGAFGPSVAELVHWTLTSPRLTYGDHRKELTNEQSTIKSRYYVTHKLIVRKGRRSPGSRFHASCRGGAEPDDATRAAAFRSGASCLDSAQATGLNETARSFTTGISELLKNLRVRLLSGWALRSSAAVAFRPSTAITTTASALSAIAATLTTSSTAAEE